MDSIVWYDYETFGAQPSWDRPAQFAAIRTDHELNEIEPPVELFCRQADDYLPNPEALLITGITPQDCQTKGIPEVEFIDGINRLMSVPGTCTAGYNSIRFDDEFTRNLLYRNFFDPYAREWQGGNSRWDLLDAIRCAYALRPDGIHWPTNDEGKVSFKLEHLTAANGLDHGRAHDAVADVRATIALAKLLKTAQPRLYQFLFEHRSKANLINLVQPDQLKPLIHISGMYKVERGCLAVIVPLCWHPTNRNSVIAFDLAQDPSELAELSVEQIQQRLFSKSADLAQLNLERLAIKEIHLNKSPVIAPANTLTPDRAEHWSVDGNTLRQSLAWLKQDPQRLQQIIDKLQQVFQPRAFEQDKDVDGQLYNGFFSSHDKQLMAEIQQKEPWDLVAWPADFEDPRGEELLFRYRARNFPETLEDHERQRWENFRSQRLIAETPQPWLTFNEFAHLLQRTAEAVAGDPVKLQWLHELQLYAESIYPLDDF